jgi:hypothetical protein
LLPAQMEPVKAPMLIARGMKRLLPSIRMQLREN